MRMRDVLTVFVKVMVILALASTVWIAMHLFLAWIIGHVSEPQAA